MTFRTREALVAVWSCVERCARLWSDDGEVSAFGCGVGCRLCSMPMRGHSMMLRLILPEPFGVDEFAVGGESQRLVLAVARGPDEDHA